MTKAGEARRESPSSSALPSPDIYWVVGDRTDAGKTTIATALIRTLNRRGTPAVGFKPVAAIGFQSSIDFMIGNYPSQDSLLFGADGLELCNASPLTGPEFLDVVAPVYLLCHPHWLRTVLVRTGSRHLGDLEFFRPSDTVSFYRRQEIRQLVARLGLPADRATPCAAVDFREIHRLAGGKPAKAFDCLVRLGPRAIVCEGAGIQLPVWVGAPVANHLFVIADGWVHFFPRIDIDLRVDHSTRALPNVEALAPLLQASGGRRVSLPLAPVPREVRNEVFENFVEELLDQAPAPASSEPGVGR